MGIDGLMYLKLGAAKITNYFDCLHLILIKYTHPPLAAKDNNKMAKKVALIHPQTGLMKSGYYGFSWTFLFFGWFVPVFRGELFVALLHLAITVVTFGIWQVIIAFLYNKQYMTRMLEKGYVFNDTEQVNEEARRKIGVAKL
jgi:hypothetical protein